MATDEKAGNGPYRTAADRDPLEQKTKELDELRQRLANARWRFTNLLEDPRIVIDPLNVVRILDYIEDENKYVDIADALRTSRWEAIADSVSRTGHISFHHIGFETKKIGASG